MSSKTLRSRGIYLIIGCAGAGLAYRNKGSHSKDAKWPDFPNLEDHHNILAKTMSKATYDSYKRITTPSGFTLDKCIQAGVDLKGSPLGKKDAGIIAGDVECYELFRDVFDQVIDGIFKRREHKKSLVSCEDINIILDKHIVKEVTARCYRNISEFPFTPACSRAQRRHIEQLVSKSISQSLPTPGDYRPVAGIPQEDSVALSKKGIVFNKPSSEQDKISGVTRDWPDSRGLYLSGNKQFSVWVNGRHHMELASYERSSDLGKAISRLATNVNLIEADLPSKFHWTSQHGFAGHDVSELGTALTLEAVVHIPRLCTDYAFLRKLTDLGLRPLTHPQEEQGYWRIATQPTFETEADQVNQFAKGIQALVDAEKELRQQ